MITLTAMNVAMFRTYLRYQIRNKKIRRRTKVVDIALTITKLK